jgi:hypothetical protein
VLAVFLAPGPAGPCLPQLFFTALVQFVSLSVSPMPLLGSQILIWFLLGCSCSCSKVLVFLVVSRGPGFGGALPLLKNLLLFVDLVWFECELLQGETGIILELPDKKLDFF